MIELRHNLGSHHKAGLQQYISSMSAIFVTPVVEVS